MTIALDPRFGKVIALMESTTHTGERASARERAATIAASCGMTFEEAMERHNAPAPPKQRSLLDDLEDAFEKAEPGYKARRATEKDEKERARLLRRDQIIAQYGSEDAALAPCSREQILRDALGPILTFCDPLGQRWTRAIDGKSHFHLLDRSARARSSTRPRCLRVARDLRRRQSRVRLLDRSAGRDGGRARARWLW